MNAEMGGSLLEYEERKEASPAIQTESKESERSSKIDYKFLTIAILLGFGGALLARYYAFIGYVPELEWKDSLTYVSVLVLSGTGLLALYGLLLFIPGAIWSELLVCDTELEGIMYFKAGQSRCEPCPVGVAQAIGWPFAVFLVIAHLPMVWSLPPSFVFGAGLFGLLPALLIMRHYLGHELQKRGHHGRSLHSLLMRYLASFGFSALVSLTAMLILYSLLADYPNPSKDTSGSQLAMLGACLLISLIANCAVALQFRHWRSRAVVVGVVASLLLFFAGEAIPQGERILSARIMAQFGVGDQSKHTLFPNEEGIRLATRLNLLPTPKSDLGALPASETGAIFGERAYIPDVQILSGLGRSYYLQIGDQRVVFPKEMVLAWEIPVAEVKAGGKSSPAADAASTPYRPPSAAKGFSTRIPP